MSRDIKCPCCRTKTVAKEHDGKIYVWCKECRKEVELQAAAEARPPARGGDGYRRISDDRD